MIKEEKEIRGLNINEFEYRIAQYADDTKVFLDGMESSLQATLGIINLFHKISGLKINLEKTRAIWLGPMAGSRSRLCPEYDLNWNQGTLKKF